jgi:hypothetical protein
MACKGKKCCKAENPNTKEVYDAELLDGQIEDGIRIIFITWPAHCAHHFLGSADPPHPRQGACSHCKHCKKNVNSFQKRVLVASAYQRISQLNVHVYKCQARPAASAMNNTALQNVSSLFLIMLTLENMAIPTVQSAGCEVEVLLVQVSQIPNLSHP